MCSRQPKNRKENQSAGNYAYTEIGELKQDNANGITDIEWRVDGKIKKIERSGNRNQVEYVYDAFGRRVLKLVKPTTSGVPNASSTWTYTYYVNDAQGNIMATYVMTESAGVQTYKLKEEYMYGASMLGNVDADVTLATYNTSSSVLTESTPDVSKRVLGEKEYLLQNHVMSNMVVVNDRFVPHNNSGTIDYYTAQVISESDYYPFGMLMVGRNNNATNYRNGFQNQQNDDEIFNIAGSLTTAEFWEYDTRLGRRWNNDPVTFAGLSPYAAFNDNPIMYVDPDGRKFYWSNVISNLKCFLGELARVVGKVDKAMNSNPLVNIAVGSAGADNEPTKAGKEVFQQAGGELIYGKPVLPEGAKVTRTFTKSTVRGQDTGNKIYVGKGSARTIAYQGKDYEAQFNVETGAFEYYANEAGEHLQYFITVDKKEYEELRKKLGAAGEGYSALDLLGGLYVKWGFALLTVKGWKSLAQATKWPWKNPSTAKQIFKASCDADAIKIQKAIGGEVVTITSPGKVLGGVTIGKETFSGWHYHKVVRIGDMIYDRITGPAGLHIDEYRKLFEYGKELIFK